MKKNRIAILLPFKDHYTNLKAGSASIWVKDFNKKSIYKNQITVFGNTDNLNDVIDDWSGDHENDQKYEQDIYEGSNVDVA